MADIRIDLIEPLYDGMDIKFKAPCDCSQINGLIVYYPKDDGSGTDSRQLSFKDAHGNDLTGLGNLFAEGALVKVMVDTSDNSAYIQNAATNGYLEEKLGSGGGSGWNVLKWGMLNTTATSPIFSTSDMATDVTEYNIVIPSYGFVEFELIAFKPTANNVQGVLQFLDSSGKMQGQTIMLGSDSTVERRSSCFISGTPKTYTCSYDGYTSYNAGSYNINVPARESMVGTRVSTANDISRIVFKGTSQQILCNGFILRYRILEG